MSRVNKHFYNSSHGLQVMQEEMVGQGGGEAVIPIRDLAFPNKDTASSSPQK